MRDTLLVYTNIIFHHYKFAEFNVYPARLFINPYYMSSGRLDTPTASELVSAHNIKGGNSGSWYSLFLQFEDYI